MPTVRITQATLASLQPINNKDTVFWDADIAGFGVKVTASGASSYIVQSRVLVGLNKKRVRLAHTSRMTVKEARDVARKQLASMDLGVDPITERKRVELTSMTLRKALEDRIAVKQLKTAVGRAYLSIAARAFPDWIDRPIATITDQMAVDRHRQITLKSGPTYANYALRILSSAFSHARGQHGLKAPNPVVRLREGKLFNRTRPRDEYLEPHELPAMLTTLRQVELERQAFDKAQQEAAQAAGLTWAGWRGRTFETNPQGPRLSYGGAADIVRVLLLTGFRLEEAQALEWSSVSLERRTITLTDNKASRTLRMPMCLALVALLKRRAGELRRADGSLPQWVFPTTGDGRYRNLSNYDMPALSRAVADAISGPFHIHAHKLRHTFATYLRGMGHSEWTVAALLNHSRQSSVTTLYAAPMTGTMHAVVDEYQGYLERLLAGVPNPSTLLSGV